jgi:hypothetical protein
MPIDILAIHGLVGRRPDPAGEFTKQDVEWLFRMCYVPIHFT